MTMTMNSANRAVALESVLRILLAHRRGRKSSITRQAARDLIARLERLDR